MFHFDKCKIPGLPLGPPHLTIWVVAFILATRDQSDNGGAISVAVQQLLTVRAASVGQRCRDRDNLSPRLVMLATRLLGINAASTKRMGTGA